MAKRTLGILVILSVVAILITLYVLRATGAISFSPVVSPAADPFGTPDQVWASLTPAQRAIQVAGTREFSHRTSDRLARLVAVQGRFRGEPRELAPFLADLESIDRSPASGPEGQQEDREARLTGTSSIMRAWFEHGPYQDDSGIQFRTLKHAISMSNSAEYNEAVVGSILVQVLGEKWVPNVPQPDELTRQLRLIDESPLLKWAVQGYIQAMRTGEAAPATAEELARIRQMIEEFRPLGSTSLESREKH